MSDGLNYDEEELNYTKSAAMKGRKFVMLQLLDDNAATRCFYAAMQHHNGHVEVTNNDGSQALKGRKDKEYNTHEVDEAKNNHFKRKYMDEDKKCKPETYVEHKKQKSDWNGWIPTELSRPKWI